MTGSGRNLAASMPESGSFLLGSTRSSTMRECRLTITEAGGSEEGSSKAGAGTVRGSLMLASERVNGSGEGGRAGAPAAHHVTKHVRLSVPNDMMAMPAAGMMGRRNSARSRRRRAVGTQDYKSCALVQTRLKLGDIM
jgi:hypothetical protein